MFLVIGNSSAISGIALIKILRERRKTSTFVTSKTVIFI